MNRRRMLLSGLCIGAGVTHASAPKPTERKRVVVVAVFWANFVELDARGQARGAIVDFVHQMNEVQDRYQFELQVVPRRRLDLMFRQQQGDVFPLAAKVWADPELNLDPTRTILRTGDVYIARADNPYGGAKVFDELAKRNLAGVLGYHYGLFENNADERAVRQRFKVQFLPNDEAVLKFVLLGRAEVGILSEAVLAQSLADPALRSRLIIAAQYDSRVDLSNLVRRGGPIGVADMNELIERMEKAGHVDRLKSRMSLKP